MSDQVLDVYPPFVGWVSSRPVACMGLASCLLPLVGDNPTAKCDLCGWALRKVGRCLHAFTHAFNSCGLWSSWLSPLAFPTSEGISSPTFCARIPSMAFASPWRSPDVRASSFLVWKVYHLVVVCSACVLNVFTIAPRNRVQYVAAPGPSRVTRVVRRASCALGSSRRPNLRSLLLVLSAFFPAVLRWSSVWKLPLPSSVLSLVRVELLVGRPTRREIACKEIVSLMRELGGAGWDKIKRCGRHHARVPRWAMRTTLDASELDDRCLASFWYTDSISSRKQLPVTLSSCESEWCALIGSRRTARDVGRVLSTHLACSPWNCNPDVSPDGYDSSRHEPDGWAT